MIIVISFYRNIVCQNVVCDKSLTEAEHEVPDLPAAVEGVVVVVQTFNTFVLELKGVVRIERILASDAIQSGFIGVSVGSTFKAR
jgi:hypothetical protein